MLPRGLGLPGLEILNLASQSIPVQCDSVPFGFKSLQLLRVLRTLLCLPGTVRFEVP